MISYFSTTWHLISALLVFFFGFILAIFIRRYFDAAIKRTIILYFWHTLFAIVYAVYVFNAGGDALGYYIRSLHNEVVFSFGTRGVDFFTSFLTQDLGLSFIGCAMVYNIFGFIGILAFDSALRKVTFNKTAKIQLLATVIVFLPSVSFWSSGIGKDAISFMSVGLALWAALNLTKRITLMVVAILLMLLVRPHMAGLMVMSLAISFVFQKSIPLIYRLGLGLISLGVVAVLVPFALNYAGVGEDAGVDQFNDYIEKRQGYNMEGGGGVDIASMSLPMQLFTYMFRPLPYEAHSIAALMASLDNMILLYLFIVGLYSLIKKRLSANLELHNRAFMWYYFVGAWFILSMTTANLGIAMRQKWMIAPMLIFLLISVIGNERSSDS
ncbi:hypothetical protein [uncultured Pseudoalteromonas sp.]|uniref:hypothetical protein n=1 Tax=uncultured Pseudoalteromonas sp. TaxID=114053 RepID=UPI00259ADFE0|nr:hypothetical protein [uncultured Pseudoalteromonas sp.]